MNIATNENISNNLLWLRAETKPFEQRTLLTPTVAAQLLEEGYKVVVERSAQRVFDDAEYESIGCRLVATHAWHGAPRNAIIMGLKELALEDGPFTRRHVHFAHVFKDQLNWQETLAQFSLGGGALYDLEYLTDKSGKRIAAFGYWAGYVGAALAVLGYSAKSHGGSLNALAAWNNKQALQASVQSALLDLADKPNALVIGALGRCGSAAVELLSGCGIDVTRWDQNETAQGGPFDALLDHDILVNCVYIDSALPPFTTLDHLNSSARRLQLISDVSCDPFGQHNPLPIYSHCTTMNQPMVQIIPGDKTRPSLELIAIDHLPSLLPRESSEQFSASLYPAMRNLRQLETGSWKRAHDVYRYHIQRLPSGLSR